MTLLIIVFFLSDRAINALANFTLFERDCVAWLNNLITASPSAPQSVRIRRLYVRGWW
jgi:hypothetical protein